MSDIAAPAAPAAPVAPAAPPPAPAANETPIDVNQTSSPQPIGSQAPDKPVGDIEGSKARPESRRESIQRAFDKARAENPPKPREAKMGDNNPPEETKVERKKPEQQPRERGEHGHFAARAEAQQDRGAQSPGRAEGVRAPTHQQLPEGTPYRDAPQRMSQQAKADWAKTPESVRGDIYRGYAEFNRAYQQYRGDHEAMNTIRPFAQLAHSQGTTLDRALSNYVSMEHKLRNDVVGGLDIIINNLNLRSPEGQKLTLADVAWHIVNQTPEQRQLLQSQNTLMAQTMQMNQMRAQHQALAQEIARMQYAQRFHATRGALDQYAETHPRLDELGDLIEREIKLGFDLDTAYKRAELLRPTHAAQTRSTTAQTRTGDKSIHGAPSGPSNGTGKRPGKPVERRDAIANAIKRVNGHL